MKSFFLILIASIISTTSFACSWYPFGEDVRFSLMTPDLFDDGGMSPYYYTSHDYGYMFTGTPENDPNVASWKEYCGGQVDEQAIFEAVYVLTEQEIADATTSENKMVQYLLKNDPEALIYLSFAKSCSDMNSVNYGWESEGNDYANRMQKMLEAIKKGENALSDKLRKRYRYLAIRLAFYNGDSDKVKSIYQKSFSGEPEDIVDYWASYFYSCVAPISAKRNFDLVQVFVHAPGKRFGALSRMSGGISIDDVLAEAKTNEERANIYIAYAVRNSGRGLNDLKAVYQLDPKNPLMDYLLVREINKIEDWVLTPRYTNFDPALNPKGGTYGLSNELILERIKDDEKYAQDVRIWLEGLSNMPNSTWMLAKAYLQGITGKQKEALTVLNGSTEFPENTQTFVQQLRVLFQTSLNADVAFSKSDQATVMNEDQANYNQFLFAVARELEFQQKTDIAAALYTQLNRSDESYDSSVSWKSPTGKNTLASDYYYSWFLYLDAEYTPEEVQGVIDFTLKQSKKKSPFERWQNRYLIDNLDRLYDLLGTKYVRQNNMSSALMAFQKVDDKLWNNYPYSMYLNANPFYADFYSGHKKNEADTVQYSKFDLVKQYQTYKTKANNPKTRNRAYYYFLLGNCELNMSHYGNSWMMRRYFWTRNMHPNNLEDDDEFYRVKRAQEYYQKAYEFATSPEVKALCLRMKGRCEKHQLVFDAPDSWDFNYEEFGGFSSYVYSKNKTYQQLINDYPDDAEDLMGYCYSFDRYFARLKNA